jgi:protein-tyrosine-phosphatase
MATMRTTTAVDALSALAHDGRLSIFKLLVRAGTDGVAAGVIARKLDMLPNTLSASLTVLSGAGGFAPRGPLDYLFGGLCPDEQAAGLSDGGLLQRQRRHLRAAGANRKPRGLLRLGEAMSDDRFNILFLCTGNSARSILAEAIMNKVGEDRFRAYSAGSQPNGTVNPHALKLLDKLGHDTSAFRSKSWDEFARPGAPKLDFVITVCDNAAGEVCPAWPGQPMTAHWGLPDPAAVKGTEVEIALAFADAYRMLSNRIGAFANLKHAALDRMSLQNRMNEIGKLGA